MMAQDLTGHESGEDQSEWEYEYDLSESEVIFIRFILHVLIVLLTIHRPIILL
jgi:hypothetical protein